MHAQDVMTEHVVTVAPDAAPREAAKLMLERRISGLPVVDGAGRVLGIVSERDLVRAKRGKGARVRDVMSHPVVSVRRSTPLNEVARLLDRHRIKRVPVLEGGRLAGIVSRADLVRHVAATPLRRAARTPRDRALRRKALEVLRQADVRGIELNATVDVGIVHLWGGLASRAEQMAVRKAVRALEGVREVVDHTTVLPIPVASGLGLL